MTMAGWLSLHSKPDSVHIGLPLQIIYLKYRYEDSTGQIKEFRKGESACGGTDKCNGTKFKFSIKLQNL